MGFRMLMEKNYSNTWWIWCIYWKTSTYGFRKSSGADDGFFQIMDKTLSGLKYEIKFRFRSPF
jgi:hypothetical protein